MKKHLVLILILAFTLIATNSFSANQWLNETSESTPLGTELLNDLDTVLFQRVSDPLDRLLTDYRGQVMKYNSAAQLTVTAGGVSCSNAGGTINTFRHNTADTTVTWSDIDSTTSDVLSTVYYVYALCDANATTNTYKISSNPSAPQGSFTLYKKLGQFTNDGSSNITAIINERATHFTGHAYGTVANGGTIALPSGYVADQCSWTVGMGSVSRGDKHVVSITYTVNSSRVATCQVTDASTTDTGTCNYIIVCDK